MENPWKIHGGHIHNGTPQSHRRSSAPLQVTAAWPRALPARMATDGSTPGARSSLLDMTLFVPPPLAVVVGDGRSFAVGYIILSI